jgi:hypothetical protein
MARIVIGANMVKYPVGGMHQWFLAWLVGFKNLGHDVYVVEKSPDWPNSCYDLKRRMMTDDCSYGVKIVSNLLRRFGLKDKLCFVDATGRYHGLNRKSIESVFKSADIFVDLEWDEWRTEADMAGLRIHVDGEPGWAQMLLEQMRNAGEGLPPYDYYYTDGLNIGTERSTAPTAGIKYRHIYPPVLVSHYPYTPVVNSAPFTTVMNWKSNQYVEYNGTTYGQKDVELLKFVDLPRHTSAPLELAISGKKVPREYLLDHGWRLRNADDVTLTIDTYRKYIQASKGEFSVAKNVFVATNCGWFGDRPGYYMASGRPVVLQDTGFSEHLPCGRGLFAFHTLDEAVAAINEINGNYKNHSKWAHDLAVEYLDSNKILKKFLYELGI